MNNPSNMSLPHGNNMFNVSFNLGQSNSLNSSSIPYSDHQPANPDLWDGHIHLISIFGNKEMVTINIKNIEVSLIYMADFIKNRNIKNNGEEDIPCIEGFGKAAWTFVSSILREDRTC